MSGVSAVARSVGGGYGNVDGKVSTNESGFKERNRAGQDFGGMGNGGSDFSGNTVAIYAVTVDDGLNNSGNENVYSGYASRGNAVNMVSLGTVKQPAAFGNPA